MTAVTLFDALALGRRPDPPSGDLGRLAEALVRSSLADWERYTRYEREYSPNPPDWDDPTHAAAVARSIYALLEAWVGEAEQVLARTRQLAVSGAPVAGAEALEDAYGFARARLSYTPERAARAAEQVRRGEFVPLKDLRTELRAGGRSSYRHAR